MVSFSNLFHEAAWILGTSSEEVPVHTRPFTGYSARRFIL